MKSESLSFCPRPVANSSAHTGPRQLPQKQAFLTSLSLLHELCSNHKREKRYSVPFICGGYVLRPQKMAETTAGTNPYVMVNLDYKITKTHPRVSVRVSPEAIRF